MTPPYVVRAAEARDYRGGHAPWSGYPWQVIDASGDVIYAARLQDDAERYAARGNAAGIGLPAYALHRARYATAYRLGMPALRAACRFLPTRTVARIGAHYARRAERAAEPERYAVTYYYRNPRTIGGYRFTGAAVGTDRFDIASDLQGVTWWTLHRRALRAVHRLDVARAAAEGRPLPR